MGEQIEVGKDLLSIALQITCIANYYQEALQMFDEGMSGFLDGGNGYLGKTNDNLELFHNGFYNQLSSLVNYLQISSEYLNTILEKFTQEDEKLAEWLKNLSGDGAQ